jgi:cell division initiation protein
MSLTPVEVRHIELRRGLFGFRRAAVRRAMEDIADSFEVVWRERADLTQRVDDLEAELGRHLELENLLRSTLVSAERAAQDLKEQARREADVIVTEANAESRRILRDAITEKERLAGDARRVQAMLRTALEIVDRTDSDAVNDEPRPALTPTALPPAVDEAEVRKLTG